MNILTFHGSWDVEVASLDTNYAQRYVIIGSAGRDGAYVAVTGDRVHVDGHTWTLSMEWNDRTGPDWHPSDVRKDARGDGRTGSRTSSTSMTTSTRSETATTTTS